jgi:adenosylcobinamide kinase/adenosylcobinamide-phosphate guanylyltransferase
VAKLLSSILLSSIRTKDDLADAGLRAKCGWMHDVGARLTLIIGGARSGKSRYAEGLITALPPPWTYLATAQSLDAEMAERIASHRARRGSGWTTVEAPYDLAGAIATRRGSPMMIDCLTLWLSNLMLTDADIAAETERLEQSFDEHGAPLVVVANEVGFGIVPDNALARHFRDQQGLLNQRIAALADRVVLMVAGLPVHVKGVP